jgi:alpha,alpha-trehalose-phosphate synthase [UDP-forming]
MWTKEALHRLVGSKLRDYRFIIVANREPYVHRYGPNRRIEWMAPASGMVAALDPIMRACGGTWIAEASGDADRQSADKGGRVLVPPDDPSYVLRRLWLTKEQELGYYYGLANEGLWPLCHVAYTRPVFHPRHWKIYRQVNQLFAQAVVEEADGDPTFVFVQDYHFALLPRMLKNAGSNFIVAQFWHIPWPNEEIFSPFPWKEELLDGLLGNDLLGFHLRSHCRHFLNLIDRSLEARISHEDGEIIRRGKSTLVRPFPISIDYEGHAETAASPAVDHLMSRWRQQIGIRNERVAIGIDRIDYIKGIPERLRAIDLFLEENPRYREQFVFVQVGVPSRMQIRAYKLLDDEIDALVEEINWKWSTDSWQPIRYFKRNFAQPELMALHRLADFCIVSSLHDGMNLVAKEFVSSRIDDDGVLILSQFTGAAHELKDAVLVNPYSIEEMAEAMREALEMPEEERQRRMQRMRAEVAGNNIYRWAGKILSALLKFDFSEEARGEPELLTPVGVSNGLVS